MATIPIEVIVQDAEAPIVPSEGGTNNTETNIAVPDTGTISSNGDTSSSASSIILPAILLVLAISSIVAILIYKYHKQKKDKISKKEKLTMAVTSTIAVLAVMTLIGNLVIPATKAATSDITDGITPAEDKVSIVVTRDGSSAEATVESKATITSTSDFGYKVLLSMAEGVETSNLYLDGDTSGEHYIAATEDAALTDNTWGYALAEDDEYSAVPLPANATTVIQGDGAVEAETLSIYYGVKVSNDLPAGTYSGGKVEYNLISLEPSDISELTYMQDFAKLAAESKADVLNSMQEETTYTLRDKRDSQDYTIAKLKDGRVWMTKNLNLAGGSRITSELSDVPEDYTLPIDYNFAENNQLPLSSQAGFNSDKAFIINTGNTGDDCSESGCFSYYSYRAATAGSRSEDDSEPNAPYSVCPGGWKLPSSSSSISDGSDFYNLAVAYGMNPQGTSDQYSSTSGNFYNQAGPNTIANFFVNGSYYNGNYFYNDSIQLMTANKDCAFNASSGAIITCGGGPDGPGRAIRCLAR